MRFGTPDRRRMTRGFVDAGPRRPDVIARILGSYQEMPGLRLRAEEAARLLGLSSETCRAVLKDLVRTQRLRVTPDDHYIL
jgi:hypothetical protein